ncbi:MAG: hypothetical protein K9N57_02805 [Candidatus Marinimicrobia bacterium]|nr:hypothetical protein [Candidatus Neomarinimicrobiota bacterium]
MLGLSDGHPKQDIDITQTTDLTRALALVVGVDVECNTVELGILIYHGEPTYSQAATLPATLFQMPGVFH